MKIFLLVLPFVVGIFVFEIVLCMALMKAASINDRQDELEQMQTELHRRKKQVLLKFEINQAL